MTQARLEQAAKESGNGAGKREAEVRAERLDAAAHPEILRRAIAAPYSAMPNTIMQTGYILLRISNPNGGWMAQARQADSAQLSVGLSLKKLTKKQVVKSVFLIS